MVWGGVGWGGVGWCGVVWGGSLQSNTAKEAIPSTVLWTQLAVNVISITREAREACVCVCV